MVSYCQEIIESFRSDDAFMQSDIRVGRLKHYDDALSNLKLESDFDRGYLSGLQETLELWRRNWKEETAEKTAGSEDYEVKLQILKMIASYKEKLK